ncbi:helix-turn-helix domain-containing protein [Enterococcus sp. AZ103]|uniref:helix-turn-helix domain-containing protein n=1 Tax=Enterococcus sp. AZ103 TaxID=2774628 RepID=UPI003F296A2C
MEQILLSADAKKKLTIIHALQKMDSNVYTINQVKALTNYSFTTVQNILVSISKDFIKLFNETFFSDNSLIHWDKQKYDHNRYLKYLIKNSLPYKFTLYTLLHPNADLADFSDYLFLSLSTVRRALRPYFDYLRQFPIKISISNLKITGDEFVIRILFGSVLWLGSSGQDLIDAVSFGDREKELFSHLSLDTPPFFNYDYTFMGIFIAKLRMEQKQFITNYPFKHLIQPDEVVYLEEYFAESFDLNKADWDISSLVYILYYLPYTFSTKDPRLKIKMAQFEDKQATLPLTSLVIEFLDEFLADDAISLNDDELMMIKANLLSALMNFSVIKSNFLLFPQYMEEEMKGKINPKSRLYQEIYAFFIKITRRKRFMYLKNSIHEITTYFSMLLLPLWKEKLDDKNLIVGIVGLEQFVPIYDLQNFFSFLTFIETRMISVYQEGQSIDPSIDFYVAETKAAIPPGEKRFFLIRNEGLSREESVLLFSKLQEQYIEKVESM